MKLRRSVVVLTLILACSAPNKTTAPTTEPQTVGTAPGVVAAPMTPPVEPDGMVLEVKETAAEEPAPAANVVAKTTPLTNAEADKLLARLPPLEAEPAQETTFAMRDKTLPVPKTGTKEQIPFPPKETPQAPPKVAPKPLTVRRYGPTGDVPIAADMSITFSQPMVAIGTVDQTKEQVPVKLSPTPAGQWRWLGTQTLTFAPDVRMPMATTYNVEVPKGTKSVTGGALEQGLKWTFTTPPIQLKESLPRDSTSEPLQPLVFMAFDQRIEPAKVLEHVTVDAHGKVAMRLATQAEIDADTSSVHYRVEHAEAGRFVVIRSVEPLPLATLVTITIKAGAPSAEGPNTTKKDQAFSFKTYGPFVMTRGNCWGDGCRPDSGIALEFSNGIDPTSFKDALVHIEPPFPAQVSVSGNGIYINGRKKSRTRYTITVDTALKDVFGQALREQAKYTVTTVDAYPQLYMARDNFATITPENPRLDILSAGQDKFHVRVYRVEPTQFFEYRKFQQEQSSYERGTPPGTLVRDSDVEVAGDHDDVTATSIDLTPALTKGIGNVIIVASGKRRYRNDVSNVAVWVQVTPWAVDAVSDGADLQAWVTELSSAKAVEGAAVELWPTKENGTTDGDGIAHLKLPPYDSKHEGRLLIAKKGDTRVMLPPGLSWWDNGRWYESEPSGRSLLWMTDDRGMYKPGETAHFKGFVRNLTAGKHGDLADMGYKELRFEVHDARGNEIGKGTTPVSHLGGFDFTASFADNVNLGPAYIYMYAGSSSIGTHNFQIQEFRRPEFEVSASVNDGVHMIGEPQNATVKSSYYAGGPLTGAPVHWNVRASTADFTPPGRDAFTFGIWRPWWRHYWGGEDASLTTSNVNGITDARGMHRIAIDPKSMKPHRATSIVAEASVTDVNRQTWSARANMLVHAASVYVGMKPERMFVEIGKSVSFDLVAVDLDGKALAGRDIRLHVEHEETVYENGQGRTSTVVDADTSVSSSEAPVRWKLTPKAGGVHKVSADVTDDKGRVNHTELTLWVPGEKRPPVDVVKHEELTLIPSKKEYAPGDTAEILVQAPFDEGEGLLLLERTGLVSTEHLKLHGGSAIVKIPITEAQVPNVHVAIEVAGGTTDAKTKTSRPVFASGALDLAVSTAGLALSLDVVPESTGLSPGESTKITVNVKDARGKAVPEAEVALIVVDEAVLALSGFDLSDPLGTMTPHRDAGVFNVYLRDSVLIARQEPKDEKPQEERDDVEMEKSADRAGNAPPPPPMPSLAAPGAMQPARARKMAFAKEVAQEPAPAISVRKDFSALAAFLPKLVADGSGRVTTTVKLPDNLTRYRVMAVAAGSLKQFGKGESTITARLPLMVRPSAPRFLNFGDKFELPAVVQNQTDKAMDVEIVARAVNLDIGMKGVRVHVGPGERLEVRFPAKTVSAGTARFQVGAAAGKVSDAADVRLPVWTPATSEAFATYGVLDGNDAILQPIAAPADVFPEAGGLTVSTSSTALQSLTDAILYLVRYPFECSEQLASRMLSLVAMKDVLAAFEVEGLPKSAELSASVAKDLEILKLRQADNGGFGYWSARRHDPFLTVHVTHALVRAKAAGFAVDGAMLSRALVYLTNVESYLIEYHESVRTVVVAYALMVRARAGDVDMRKAHQIFGIGAQKLSAETLGFLLTVAKRGNDDKLATDINKELERRVTETAASAHFVTNYSDGAHLILASERRSDAIILGGLMEARPKSDLIPKVVRGLLDGRRKGHWYTTQENVFVLLALGDYFRAFESQTPDFVARLWLGSEYEGEATFKGRETVTRELVVPMAKLVTAAKDFTLQKQGQGRLYYRIGLDYAPKSLDLASRDNGFAVERTYEPVDDPKSVVKDKDGVWHVKAGAKVRIKLTMVAQAVRYHVALVDPLPAGFEAINAALAVSESGNESTGGTDDDDRPSRRYRWWWNPIWYEHENLRDERVEAFGGEVWAGVHSYTYMARATTPGEFVVPPTKAEEMYAPETFGRSASTRVIVE